MKKKSANERAGLYQHTNTAKLTFDHLSPENNGIYTCQADVQTKSVSDFVETKEITVQGKMNEETPLKKAVHTIIVGIIFRWDLLIIII